MASWVVASRGSARDREGRARGTVPVARLEGIGAAKGDRRLGDEAAMEVRPLVEAAATEDRQLGEAAATEDRQLVEAAATARIAGVPE